MSDKMNVKTITLAHGYIVKGWLEHDEDCENPLWSDGMGSIRSLSARHVNNIDHDAAVQQMKENHMVIPLSYFEHGNCLWGVEGSLQDTPDFSWDGVSFAGIWTPDQECVSHIRCEALAKVLPAGVSVSYQSKYNTDGTTIRRKVKDGEKPYFADGTTIDERFSNIITLKMPDGWTRGGYSSFYNAYSAACRRLSIKLPRWLRLKYERQAAVECAKQACEVYTAWCNGECYCRLVTTTDDTGCEVKTDGCTGFIGYEHASKELNDVFDQAVKDAESKQPHQPGEH